MQTDVAILHPREVVITSEQTELMKKTICQGATDAEMQLFFYDCQRRGVHPLDKLIHFTKRSGKYTPITSIDFMRQRAQASGDYAGSDEAIHTLAADGLPDSCKIVVYRMVQGQRCAWTAIARWKEYYPGDQLGFMWKKMPFLMLEKCAEALALRKAFPAELQGLYVKEEMDQAEQPPRPAVMDAKRTAQAKIQELREQPQGRDAGDAFKAAPMEQNSATPPQTSDSPAAILEDYLTKIDLSQSVSEVSALLNAAVKDERLDVFQVQKVQDVAKVKIVALRKGK